MYKLIMELYRPAEGRALMSLKGAYIGDYIRDYYNGLYVWVILRV